MKARYIGEQLNAETNIGKVQPGQVIEVTDEGSIASLQTLISHGDFEEVDEETPVGIDEKAQKKNRKTAEQQADDAEAARQAALSGATDDAATTGKKSKKSSE